MMDTELTPEEKAAIQQVQRSSKWDVPTIWFSVLAPCIIIGAIGVWNESIMVVSSAGLAFVILAILGMPKQMRQQHHLKSAIKKLKAMAFANKEPEATR